MPNEYDAINWITEFRLTCRCVVCDGKPFLKAETVEDAKDQLRKNPPLCKTCADKPLNLRASLRKKRWEETREATFEELEILADVRWILMRFPSLKKLPGAWKWLKGDRDKLPEAILELVENRFERKCDLSIRKKLNKDRPILTTKRKQKFKNEYSLDAIDRIRQSLDISQNSLLDDIELQR